MQPAGGIWKTPRFTCENNQNLDDSQVKPVEEKQDKYGHLYMCACLIKFATFITNYLIYASAEI